MIVLGIRVLRNVLVACQLETAILLYRCCRGWLLYGRSATSWEYTRSIPRILS